MRARASCCQAWGALVRRDKGGRRAQCAAAAPAAAPSRVTAGARGGGRRRTCRRQFSVLALPGRSTPPECRAHLKPLKHLVHCTMCCAECRWWQQQRRRQGSSSGGGGRAAASASAAGRRLTGSLRSGPDLMSQVQHTARGTKGSGVPYFIDLSFSQEGAHPAGRGLAGGHAYLASTAQP